MAGRTSADDEDLRDFYKASLKLAIMQTIQALEMTVLELDMLAKAPPPSEDPTPEGEESDIRSRGIKQDGYSEKLDSIQSSIKGGALLSKEGRPLRPFTLIDKREQLKKGVFGPGHNLPTMSIDEYLEEERRRGGIIEGGGFVTTFKLCLHKLTNPQRKIWREAGTERRRLRGSRHCNNEGPRVGRVHRREPKVTNPPLIISRLNH